MNKAILACLLAGLRITESVLKVQHNDEIIEAETQSKIDKDKIKKAQDKHKRRYLRKSGWRQSNPIKMIIFFCHTDAPVLFSAYHKRYMLTGIGATMTRAARDLHKLVGKTAKFWLSIRPKRGTK